MKPLTATQAAFECNVNKKTVINWAKAGMIPGAAQYGRQWRFDPVRFRRWKKLQEVTPCQSINVAKSGGYDLSSTVRNTESPLEVALDEWQKNMNGN